MKKIVSASSALPIVALLAASITSSCSSDSLSEGENAAGGEGKTVTLTAKVNESEATTRMGMTKGNGNEVSFYWHSSDEILVQTVNGSTYSGAKFTTNTETGKASAEFTGTVASTEKLGQYAVYPYSESHKFTSETSLTYNLPAAYTYNNVESGIFSKTENGTTSYRSTSTNIPLVGKIEDGKIEFKHIGGLAVIRIDNMPAASGTLTVTADQQLCGDFTIGNLSADEPKMTTTTSSDNKTVTIKFSGATAGSVGVFYLPLATGSYSGLKIGINYGTTTQTVNYGNLYVARASVNAVPLYNVDGKLCKWSKANSDGTYTINGQKFVDLGLSVLWATCNVGASSAYDYGKCYAWGEVTAYNENKDWGDKGVKTNYNFDNYKYGTSSSLTKYNGTDNLTTLEAGDDAATVNWGSSCRMPTQAEFDELLNSNNCSWSNTTENGVSGYKVTSKKEGYTDKSIFLPANGSREGETLYNQGSSGGYWSSSCSTSDYSDAFRLSFGSTYSNQNCVEKDRCFGSAVRPVAEKQ